jgi:glycosidase
MRKRSIVAFALLFVTVMATAALAEPWMGHLAIRDPVVWPAGRTGNYGTVKYFIDEAKAETVPIEVTVQVYADGRPPADLEVQVFTNLNRRDFAKVFEHPDAASGPTSYWQTVPMAHVAQSGNNHIYRANLSVSKTGAYRLTARFRIAGGPWLWHSQFAIDGVAQRDAAIVVSPRKTLDLTLYEVNPLVAEATPGGGAGQRSTLEDFTDRDADGYDPFNLTLIRNTLGFNGVWLMPVFPVTQTRFDPVSRTWGSNHSPGSPYATRNYYAISPQLADAGTEASAISEFLHLVNHAEALGLDVFIDVAFNHAGRDVVFGQGAVQLGVHPNATDLIRSHRPAWATSTRNFREHAAGPDDLAAFAPADRLGEHSWYDAGFDWFFGDYASLGPKAYIGDVRFGGAEDERDAFWTDLDPAGGHDFEVENVWNYFASILPFWIEQTGGKLDGIRADFSQGLPPQLWEYIINKTRQVKWDFVFLAEVLDPDKVRYRVNRQFDIVTTVDHHLYRDNAVSMSQLRGSLEAEAALYGYNAAVMHNGTSHDEQGNGNVWLMTARYAVAAALHGVPMVYMSQPLGVAHKVNFESTWENIKAFWDDANPHVFTIYKRINQARADQPALRSTNRWFLDRRGGGFNESIFSIARWQGSDVVLVFVNLRDHVVGPEAYSIPEQVPLDRSSGVRYQAFNLVGDDPNAALWPSPRTADEIYGDGVYVGFSVPNETQYLVLRKVP